MATMTTVEALFAALVSGDTSVIPVLEDAILEGVTGTGPFNVIVTLVTTKATKRTPSTKVTGAFAVVIPGVSVRLVGSRYGQGYDRTFRLGSTAEYDSFNLSYFGEIVSIGERTITISKKWKKETARLDLASFSSRNRDFDVHAAAAQNSETMMHI